MPIAVDQIVSRLQQGATLEELLRSFLPEAERALHMRCATVRTFDERLVDQLFRPDVPGGSRAEIPFEKLVNQDIVETVAAGVYRLRLSSRREYFELWWQGANGRKLPPALRELSARLVAYYRAQGPGCELDVLYHLSVVDARAAATLFNQLYNEADAGFDLGRCQDLLQVLEQRQTLLAGQPLLAQTLLKLYIERQSYFKARCMWSLAYYQTVYYYELAQLERAFQALLDDDKKWILQLYAPGGMGKTMFLRWLTARRCVPEPWKIPCAQVDFDQFDPVTVTQNPWMLILEVAQQLNEQIPGSLFAEQLGDLIELKQCLRRPDPATPVRAGATPPRRPLEDIPQRFAKVLKSAALKQPVVLIFDTLEEVILYQGTDLMALLREVKKLHDVYPNLRLILSGRYDLAESLNEGERLAGFAREFGSVTRPLKLAPFEDADARKYLIEKRGIDRLLAPVVARAKGNPFKLSLYADLLRSSPRITEREIRESPSDLLYLIRRVLLRIPDARVRWLLRYGIVPRKLTLAFVKEVMAPHLPKAMSGTSKFDNPDNELPEVLRRENAFRKVLKSPAQKVDVEQLWQTLTRYASSYSWVSPDKDANTLSFHPEVSTPMRALLRNQPIFRRLHRAAINHFEQRAQAEPERWVDFIKEAVYHKFQVDGAAAASYWHTQIEHPNAAEQPEWRRTLAREVVDLAAVRSDDTQTDAAPLVDQALLAQAQFEIARANVELAHAAKADRLDANWQEASKLFTAYEQLQLALPKPVVPPARVAFVRAALLSAQGRTIEAQKVLQSALRRKASADDKLKLELEYADLLQRAARLREATHHYRAALRLAPKAKVKVGGVLDIRRKLAEHFELTGDLKKAAHEYQLALQQAAKTGQNVIGLELVQHMTGLHLRLGNLAEARAHAYKPFKRVLPKLGRRSTEALQRMQAEERSKALHFFYLQGRVELAARAPLAAVERCSAGLRAVEQALSEGWPASGQELPKLYAQLCELLGLAQAALLEHRPALDALEAARSRWKEVQDNAGANRCLLHTAEIQLRLLGNVKAAQFILEQAEQLTTEDSPDLWVRRETLWIEALDQLNVQNEAKKRLHSLDTLLKREKYPPAIKAAAAVAALAHRARRGLTVPTRELTAAIRSVQPPGARLALLADLSWCPTPKKVAKPQAAAFAGLVPEPRWSAEDGRFAALTTAEALRVVGRSRAPLSLLEAALTAFAQQKNLFALREVWGAWDRLGGPHKARDLSPQVAEFVTAFQSYPNLCTDTLLAHAARLLTAGRHEAAQTLIDELGKFVPRDEGTRWLALYQELRARLAAETSLAQPKPLPKRHADSVLRGLALLLIAARAYDALGKRIEAKRLEQLATTYRKRLEAAQTRPAARGQAKRKAQPKPALAPTYEKLAKRFAHLNDPRRATYVVQISRTSKGDGLTIKTSFGAAAPRGRNVKAKSDEALALMLAVPPGEVFGKDFVDIFPKRWLTISAQLQEIVLANDRTALATRTKQHALNLRLEIDDPVLAAVPWELALTAMPGKRTFKLDKLQCMYRSVANDNVSLSWSVRSLQSALSLLLPDQLPVDGIYGRLTQNAVKVIQRKAGLPQSGLADERTWAQLHRALSASKTKRPPEVLIVQASREQQVKTTRGHLSSGLSLAAVYKSAVYKSSVYKKAGAKVTVLEDPPLDVLHDMLRRTEAQVLHLCPIMRRSPHVGIYLDFGGLTTRMSNYDYTHSGKADVSGSGAAAPATNPVSLTILGRLLAENAQRRKSRPVIILDVPRPPVLDEAVRQLMLRNAFASEIFRMNNTSAVLATGLAHSERVTYDLVAALMGGGTFGQTVTAIRRQGPRIPNNLPTTPSDQSSMLNYVIDVLGMALFTHNPAGWVF